MVRFRQLCDLALRISFNLCDVLVKHRLDFRARAFVMNLHHARQQCERARFLHQAPALSGLPHHTKRRTLAQVAETNLSLSMICSCWRVGFVRRDTRRPYQTTMQPFVRFRKNAHGCHKSFRHFFKRRLANFEFGFQHQETRKKF